MNEKPQPPKEPISKKKFKDLADHEHVALYIIPFYSGAGAAGATSQLIQWLGFEPLTNPYLVKLSRARKAGTANGKFNRTYFLNLVSNTLIEVQASELTAGEVRAINAVKKAKPKQ